MKPEPRGQKDGLIGGGSPERMPYEAPAIIYEGLITTRAGSRIPGSQDGYDVAPELPY